MTEIEQLSVIIPAYNEARRIRESVNAISEFLAACCERWEVVVVDDGSSDGTAELVPTSESVVCLINETNRGKGYSVRRGIASARYEVVLFTDADLSAPIVEARRLHAAIADGADVAVGSRSFDVTTSVRRTPVRRFLAFGFRMLVKLIAVRGIFDTQCGFKMFRKSAAEQVFSRQRLSGWGFDVEILHIAQRRRLRIDEVSVSWSESDESCLRWYTPLTMFVDLLKIRWNGLRGRYN